MTYFLRFTDEAAFTSACESAGLWIDDDSPRPLLLSHTHILDVIGTITEGGEWDPETGEEITPPTVLDGWHVNAKSFVSRELKVYYDVDGNGDPVVSTPPADGTGPWKSVLTMPGQDRAWLLTVTASGGGGGPFSVATYIAYSAGLTRTMTLLGTQPNHNGHGIVEAQWSTTSSSLNADIQVRLNSWGLAKAILFGVRLLALL